MPHVLAQVRLKRTTNMPEDVVINTFHFDSGVSEIELQEIADALVAFYTAGHGGEAAIATFLSPVLNATPHEIRLYNMSGPAPHPPIWSVDFTMVGIPQSGTPLPSEVALVLTTRAASGANPQRRRGRVYIGPLSAIQTTGIFEGDARPTLNSMESLVAAGAFLRDTFTEAATTWSVWSEVDLVLRPIIEVSTDNAFDTQRRRGAAPYFRLSNPA